jgi:hypothetical protein
MRPWTRLQDWVTLLAGIYTATSPIVLSTIGMTGDGKVAAPWVVGYAGLTGAAWTSWLVGALVVVVSLTVVRASGRHPHPAPAPIPGSKPQRA